MTNRLAYLILAASLFVVQPYHINTVPTYDKSECLIINGEITSETLDSIKAQGNAKHIENKKNVCLIVTTFGGEIDSGYKIVDYLKENDRTLTVIVPDYAMSMGAMIAHSADYLVVNRSAVLMYHIPRLMANNNMIVIGLDHHQEIIKKFFTETNANEMLGSSLTFRYLTGENLFLTGGQVYLKAGAPTNMKVIDDEKTVQERLDGNGISGIKITPFIF